MNSKTQNFKSHELTLKSLGLKFSYARDCRIFQVWTFQPLTFIYGLFNTKFFFEKFRDEDCVVEKSRVEAWGLEIQGWNVLQPTTSVMEDVASMMETVWNMTAFEGAEVPDILHPKLWSEDFATFMDSMMNSNDIDFTM